MTLGSIWRGLLRLYPARHRARFDAEMLRVFEAACGEPRGAASWVRFAAGEMAGLLKGAAVEWVALLRRPEGCAQTAAPVHPSALPAELAEAESRVQLLVGRIVHAIANHQFEVARCCSWQEREEREKLRVLREKY